MVGHMLKMLYRKVGKGSKILGEDHVGAYAAQSAFFWVLSLIPTILLLLTMVQFTPLTKSNIIYAVKEVIPKSFNELIISIVNQVYSQSKAMIPVTAIVALWSAGRGVLAMTTGLNSVYDAKETRNYLFIRIRATFYTVLFITALIVTLLMLVFGNSISLFVNEHAPVVSYITDFMIQIRTVLSLLLLTVFSTCIYRFLPNRKAKLRKQIPGALFTSVGWLLMSYIFSVYLEIFKGFSSMYGSLTTIVLIMLWLYVCMYIMLLGGELNVYMEERF